MSSIKNLEIKINQLTPELIDELDNYLDYLINKRTKRSTKKLNQKWAGGLKNEHYDSIDLQKKALEWRQK
ncbi:MAG: DUF2281 domain-containing protein [Bacteroidota bacterium]